jgi:hypothetical protein
VENYCCCGAMEAEGQLSRDVRRAEIESDLQESRKTLTTTVASTGCAYARPSVAGRFRTILDVIRPRKLPLPPADVSSTPEALQPSSKPNR